MHVFTVAPAGNITDHGRAADVLSAALVFSLTNTLSPEARMCARDDHDGLCMIPPSPALRTKLQAQLEELAATAPALAPMLKVSHPRAPGLNDGLILPGDYFPLGTPLERVRNAAGERAPLRGPVRVVVVLVDFPDQSMAKGHTRKHFQDLFFSTGVIPTGSVKEFYTEVTRGQIDITGEVVGPYRLPRKLSEYANGKSGMGSSAPNARTMARDAAELANKDVNFAPYDNDGNGFVDAFIVLHAGRGAEETGNPGDIWSHKWVLAGGEYNADGTRIYGYLTVPEDAKIGVCCHELGHLLFGWPDLYDTDNSSEGLGNWCLMAGGSWNGDGDVPSHPSAWCKAQQGWVEVVNQTTNAQVGIADVKDGHAVYRLWKQGAAGKEYFLVENRQRRNFDRMLPGEGLLVYHVDESVDSNADERHPMVALLQADGVDDLGHAKNRGDAGDPYPGTSSNASLTVSTTPNTKGYNGVPTNVSITGIGASAPVMLVNVAVQPQVTTPRRKRHRRTTRQPARLWRAGQLLDTEPEREIETEWMEAVDQRLEAVESTLTLLRSLIAADRDVRVPAGAGAPESEPET